MNVKSAGLLLLLCFQVTVRVRAGWEELAVGMVTVAAGCFFVKRVFNVEQTLLAEYCLPERAVLFKKKWLTELCAKNINEPGISVESMVDAYIELRALLEDTWCEALDDENSSPYEQRCYSMLYKELRHKLEAIRLCIESSVSLLAIVEHYTEKCQNGVNKQDCMEERQKALRTLVTGGARCDVRFGTICQGETAIDFARQHNSTFLVKLFDAHNTLKNVKCNNNKEVEYMS